MAPTMVSALDAPTAVTPKGRILHEIVGSDKALTARESTVRIRGWASPPSPTTRPTRWRSTSGASATSSSRRGPTYSSMCTLNVRTGWVQYGGVREVSSTTERVSAMSRPGAPSQLLERSHELSTLADALAAVRQDGHGRLVFIGGEVGVGKTTLVRRFCSEYSESPRVLWGPCDALFSPRPLGPLVDIVESTPSGLKELVATGARPHEVAGALVRELHAEAPTILVLEDVHWADEATLDVLRLLYRRLDTVPALVLATYRDDELDRAHPLRIVLGELATERAVGAQDRASLLGGGRRIGGSTRRRRDRTPS